MLGRAEAHGGTEVPKQTLPFVSRGRATTLGGRSSVAFWRPDMLYLVGPHICSAGLTPVLSMACRYMWKNSRQCP